MTNKSYVGVIIALEYEIAEFIDKCKKIFINNNTFYIYNDELVIIFSGVGKVNAALGTTALINNFNIRQVINIGSSCTANDMLDILNIHVVENCQYGDVDVSCDPNYQINQIPYEPKKFYCNNNVIDAIRNKLVNLARPTFSGCAITIDSFLTSKNLNNFFEINCDDVYSIDMESASIGQVCNHYNIPFNCIKIISDKINIDKNNHDEYNDNINTISFIINELMLIIVELINNKQI